MKILLAPTSGVDLNQVQNRWNHSQDPQAVAGNSEQEASKLQQHPPTGLDEILVHAFNHVDKVQQAKEMF